MKTKFSVREKARRSAVLTMIAAALLVAMIGSAWAEQAGVATSVPVGGSRIMDFQNIKRAAVSDPSVADYVVLTVKQIMLTGKAPGATDFYVWDDKGQHQFRVAVTATPSVMADTVSKIRDAIGRPGIRVSEHNGIILLEGDVDTTVEADRAGAIAAAYAPHVTNLIKARSAEQGPTLDVAAIQAAAGPGIKVSALSDRVLLVEGTASPEQKARLDQIIRGLGNRIAVVDTVLAPSYKPRQILVHVKVVDVDRSTLDEIGVTWGGLTSQSTDTGQVTQTAHDQPILFGEAFTGPLGLNQGGPIKRLEGLSAQLKALETRNRARVLAEPNLLVTEGKMASILVGGEIPIPVVQTASGAATGAAGAITVEWKEFGVRLAVQGTVSRDGKSIDLDVSPEVSSLDFGNAIVVSNIVLPALRVRKAQTVLHMNDGQTLVIGGLYQTEWTKNVRAIPLLGQLPILGELFRRTDKQRRDTELVILVTPEIMTEASAATRTEAALKTAGENPK
jgi:pilus assembly protein CpaC